MKRFAALFSCVARTEHIIKLDLLNKTYIGLIIFFQTEKLFAKGYLNEKEKNRAHQQTSRLFPKGVLPHGADALRLALLSCDVYMENVSFDVQRVITARNFCNKIWQGKAALF